MDIKKESLQLHEKLAGKIEITPRIEIKDKHDLSLAYTPGVAEACLKIKECPSDSYKYTRRKNMVAVITDGTAVLGLGDIGPLASMPVMEGKALLFKTFANVDAFPISIDSKDTDELVRTISLLQNSFGGINLEDISAPRCFEIEQRLVEKLDIPVFHDDQHGTAIVVSAALINALKLVQKEIDSVKIVINGAGAAGISIADFLIHLGARDIILLDKKGILDINDTSTNYAQKRIAMQINPRQIMGTLVNAMSGADVFIGVSGPNCVSKDMISSMNSMPIIFALANPVPEITPEDAKSAGAFIIGTGSSLYPNQINNVLAFPGIFRGALDGNAKKITDTMMIAATYAIANSVSIEELSVDKIIPDTLDLKVHHRVAEAVQKAI